MADHVGDFLLQTRAAVGLFVSNSLAPSLSEDHIEILAASAYAVRCIWAIKDVLVGYLREAEQDEPEEGGDGWVGNWKLLRIIATLATQIEGVAVFVVVKLVTDLVAAIVGQGFSNSKVSSAAVSVALFVAVDAASKSRFDDPTVRTLDTDYLIKGILSADK